MDYLEVLIRVSASFAVVGLLQIAAVSWRSRAKKEADIIRLSGSFFKGGKL